MAHIAALDIFLSKVVDQCAGILPNSSLAVEGAIKATVMRNTDRFISAHHALFW